MSYSTCRGFLLADTLVRPLSENFLWLPVSCQKHCLEQGCPNPVLLVLQTGRVSVLRGGRRLHPGSRVSRGTHFLHGRTENLAGLGLWRTGFGHPGPDHKSLLDMINSVMVLPGGAPGFDVTSSGRNVG